MFYDPRTEKHGLKHSPVTALVVPRPIGWISTLSPEGVGQSRAVQLLQPRIRLSAVGDFLERSAKAFADQC